MYFVSLIRSKFDLIAGERSEDYRRTIYALENAVLDSLERWCNGAQLEVGMRRLARRRRYAATGNGVGSVGGERKGGWKARSSG